MVQTQSSGAGMTTNILRRVRYEITGLVVIRGLNKWEPLRHLSLASPEASISRGSQLSITGPPVDLIPLKDRDHGYACRSLRVL